MDKVIQGDCFEVLKEIKNDSVDSIVTDPPYELGFMGKSWDNTGIANNPEMWRECLRVLKPGGHLLSFGGTRTYHRMAVAIEDSGFEIRDMIEWVYGSGFPKSHNIGKKIDQIQGNEREVVEEEHWGRKNRSYETEATVFSGNRQDDKKDGKRTITKGTSEWEGYGTALKPSHEPICMARKPLSEKTVALNVLKWEVGGIDIDGSRVGNDKIINRPAGNKKGGNSLNMSKVGMPQDAEETISQGRFPANLILSADEDGQVSEEVRECFPDTKSGNLNSGHKRGDGTGNSFMGGGGIIKGNYGGDSGNASRYFKSIFYSPKASKKERGAGNTHSTVKPIALMEYLIKMITPKGGTVLDPFAGSGTTGLACKNLKHNYILIEKESEYIKIIKERLKN